MSLFWSATPCASPPPGPSIFSDYSFRVHHPVNWDDQQLLAHAMASDFSVTWQWLSKRTIGFSLWIKLHAQRMSQFSTVDKNCFRNSGPGQAASGSTTCWPRTQARTLPMPVNRKPVNRKPVHRNPNRRKASGQTGWSCPSRWRSRRSRSSTLSGSFTRTGSRLSHVGWPGVLETPLTKLLNTWYLTNVFVWFPDIWIWSEPGLLDIGSALRIFF
jgi:hypothetical protein